MRVHRESLGRCADPRAVDACPQFGEQEMALLAASNHALARISRSLGPVIREVDRDGTAAVAGNARLLVELKAQIDAHLRAVSDLLRANIDRWSR